MLKLANRYLSANDQFELVEAGFLERNHIYRDGPILNDAILCAVAASDAFRVAGVRPAIIVFIVIINLLRTGTGILLCLSPQRSSCRHQWKHRPRAILRPNHRLAPTAFVSCCAVLLVAKVYPGGLPYRLSTVATIMTAAIGSQARA